MATSYLATIGTVVGTTLVFVKSRSVWPGTPLSWGMFIGIFLPVMLHKNKTSKLIVILAVVALSFYVLSMLVSSSFSCFNVDLIRLLW